MCQLKREKASPRLNFQRAMPVADQVSQTDLEENERKRSNANKRSNTKKIIKNTKKRSNTRNKNMLKKKKSLLKSKPNQRSVTKIS